MKNRRSLLCAYLALALLVSALVGCTTGDLASLLGGGSLGVSKFLVVAEYDNNRVTIFNLPITTNASAINVLGEPDFTTSTGGTSATTMDGPIDATADASGNLWVTEYSNCRMTFFGRPFANGEAATIALGAPDLTSAPCSSTATTLDGPSNAAFDSTGHLWQVDYNNSRVVRYSPPFTTGQAADLVLGQPDLTSNSCGTTATTLCTPWQGVAFDSSGNIWISDYDNCRILRYSPPFATGMAANLVIGQPDFTSSNCGATATLNDGPYGMAFDSSGNLWVADGNENRVLKFAPPFATNMAATAVIGQPDLTSSSCTTTASGLCTPYDVEFDTSGNMYIADASNNRVLMFKPPFTTGMSATAVLGQPDFTSSGSSTTANTMDSPDGITTIRQ